MEATDAMMQFADCRSFARFLQTVATELPAAQSHGMAAAAEIMHREAVAEIGTYQTAAGRFPAWPELAPSTVEDRLSKGFSPDEPLLRTGDLRESIEASHDHNTAVVGSNDARAVYQELGTTTIPARSFIGRALFVTQDACISAVMRKILTPMVGAIDADRLTLLRLK